MKIQDLLRLGRKAPAAAGRVGRRLHRRNFNMAKMGRLTADWTTSTQSADAEIWTDLRTLRNRSRELCRNNPYAKRYLRLLDQNVVGPTGVKLQARTRDGIGRQGRLDKVANERIETAWQEWSHRDNCTVNREKSLIEVMRYLVRAMARDGEALIRIARGVSAGNDFNFALQPIDPDLLDQDLNVADAGNGNRVSMGVEMTPTGRRVAYHFLIRHPGDHLGGIESIRRHERVPAENVIHVFDPDRANQSRGVPWLHSVGEKLHNLRGYDEAELFAARTAAAKMGFFLTTAGDDYVGDDEDDEGNLITEASPGTFETLPPGVKEFKTYDPNHPSTAYGEFVKAQLRGAGAGLGISYNALAGDYEGVNFSSLRAAALEDRDFYRTIQHVLLIGQFLDRVYRDWLPFAIVSGQLRLSIERLPKYRAVEWQPRGWQWVDPAKEVTAHAKAIDYRLRSRQGIVAETGRDIEDVFGQIKVEEDMAAALGLSLAPPSGAPGGAPEPQPEGGPDGGNDTESDEDEDD